MTKIIVGYPCIGKSMFGRGIGKDYVMDLEFRESATTKGMSPFDRLDVFSHYINVIKKIMVTNYYEYLLVTDDVMMVNQLTAECIPFCIVIPHPNDDEYKEIHKIRTIDRSGEDWYQSVIEHYTYRDLWYLISIAEKNKNVSIKYLNKEKPYITDVIDFTEY